MLQAKPDTARLACQLETQVLQFKNCARASWPRPVQRGSLGAPQSNIKSSCTVLACWLGGDVWRCLAGVHPRIMDLPLCRPPNDRLAAKPNLSGNILLDNGKADKMIVGRQNGRERQV